MEGEEEQLLHDASDAKALSSTTGRGLQSIAAIGRSLDIQEPQISHGPQVLDRATLIKMQMEGKEEQLTELAQGVAENRGAQNV